MDSNSTRERRLAEIAAMQAGLFTIAQAVTVGFSRQTIMRRQRSGQWTAITQRVLRPSIAPPLDWRGRLLAEQLSTSAIVAAESALALYGVLAEPAIDHFVVTRSKRNLGRYIVHSTRQLPGFDIWTYAGFRVTSPVRSILLAAERMESAELADLITTCAARRLIWIEGLLRRAHELDSRWRVGCARVITAVDAVHPEAQRLRNDWEQAVLAALSDASLPEPRINYRLHVGGRWRELDFAWPEQRIDLEFDGFDPHASTRAVFDDDRSRQNDLVAAGWKVFRITSTTMSTGIQAALVPLAAQLRCPTVIPHME